MQQPTKLAKTPTIRRFPLYLQCLYDLRRQGREVVSSTHLARDMAIDAVLVKKDLEVTGVSGKTGVGYATEEVIEAIEDFLGWNNTTEAFLVGTGDLGSALLGYGGFDNHGLKIVAGFDIDPEKVGTEIHDVQVLHLDTLGDLVRRMGIRLAVLTVPSESAQATADRLVESGVRGIWNFTPVKLRLPEGVVVQREDLSAGLAELSVKLQQNDRKEVSA